MAERSGTARRFRDIRRRLFDLDYSPSFQDEYQRLWHEAAKERDELRRQLNRLGWKRYMVADE